MPTVGILLLSSSFVALCLGRIEDGLRQTRALDSSRGVLGCSHCQPFEASTVGTLLFLGCPKDEADGCSLPSLHPGFLPRDTPDTCPDAGEISPQIGTDQPGWIRSNQLLDTGAIPYRALDPSEKRRARRMDATSQLPVRKRKGIGCGRMLLHVETCRDNAN